MATATKYSPAQVAQEVKSQGGSNQQAWVAAALVDGIESNGTLTDKNPSSTACGLFQFLTTTWESNGGTRYAPTACGASLSQQVAVFLTASAGNNFYPWSPDLGGSYNGKPITAPQSGSAVANHISSLAAGGSLFQILGSVPTNWADAGSAPAGNPVPGPVGSVLGLATGGTATAGIPNPLSAITDVDSFFKALGSGFGLGWAGIFTIILGIAMIGVGLIFLFRRQAASIGHAAIRAA